MPLKISCPKCQKQYTVSEQAAGKSVKCQDCQHTFSVPRAPAMVQASKGSPAAVSRPPAMNTELIRELARLGVDGPIVKSADPLAPIGPLGGPDPLANHVVQGLEFVPVDPAQNKKREEEAEAESRNPYSTIKKRTASPGGKVAAAAAAKKTAAEGDQRLAETYGRLARWFFFHSLSALLTLIGLGVAAWFWFMGENPSGALLDNQPLVIAAASAAPFLILAIVTGLLALAALGQLQKMLHPEDAARRMKKAYFIPLAFYGIASRTLAEGKGTLLVRGAQVTRFGAKFPT